MTPTDIESVQRGAKSDRHTTPTCHPVEPDQTVTVGPEQAVIFNHHRHELGPHQIWGFTSLRDARDYAGAPFVDLLRTSR
jgi:hypothetical protein